MSFKETEVGFIPESWEVVELGEVADVLSGYAFKSKDFVEEGVAVIKIKNIIPPYVSLEDVQYVSRELFDENEKFQLKYNDILISMTGSNYNQMSSAVGKVGRIRLKDTPMLLNQRVGKVIPKKSICDKDYLYYNISTLETRYRLALSAGGSANQANISSKQIKNLKIPFPTITEQKSIAHILSTLDEKIEVNNKINKTLENMAQAIFKQWFVDFEFPNEDGEPYKSSGGEMVESELGMIPEGWEVSNIDMLTELIIDHRGKTPKKLGGEWSPNGIIALSAKCIKNGKLVNLEQANKVDEKLYYIWMKDELKYGDILLTSEAPLGELYFLAANEKYCLSQRLFALRANRKYIYPEILYMFLQSSYVMKSIQHRATGTTVMGIRQSELRKVEIVKPLIYIQKEFGKIINSILKKIYSLEKENYRLNTIRDTLLPKLMSGEIRVPLESDSQN